MDSLIQQVIDELRNKYNIDIYHSVISNGNSVSIYTYSRIPVAVLEYLSDSFQTKAVFGRVFR